MFMNARQMTMANRRLFGEESVMDSLNVPGYVDVKGVGNHPYREYLITVKAKIPLKSGGEGSEHVFQITAPLQYPLDAPVVCMKTPPVSHVNIFENGSVCIGNRWSPVQTLASVALRTIRVVLLDPSTFNYDSKADDDSESFCRRQPKKWEVPFPLPVPKWVN